MTDPMPGSRPPTQRYTRELVALRQGLEATVDHAQFNAEGTRRMIRGEPPTVLPPAAEAEPHDSPAQVSATEPQAMARAERTLEDVIVRLAASRPDHFTPLHERVVLAVRLCQAVAVAHASGVLLNDLKPALIGVGLFGEVNLVDRGSATPLGASGAKVTGTPAYMSPEQARGETLTPASDIYALGVVCWRLFTLRYPLWDTDPEVFWERKRRGVLDTMPESVEQQVPAALLAICRHALAPQAGDRYLDAAAMARDLQSFLEGRAVSVCREALPRRLLRIGQRHRLILAVAAVIVLAAIVMVQVSDSRRIERERLQQQLAASEAANGARIAEGEMRAADLRRRLDDVERQRGWRQVIDLDFAKPIDPRLQAVQVNEGVRIESNAVALLRQASGVLEILPASHRTFVRWSDGISEDARIDLEVESPGAKGWNLDITVAGDPLTGYRLRLFGQDYLSLESISRGWADQLVKIPSPPIAGRERLAVSLQHSAGRITASIDGKVLIDYIDPTPLAGPTHRSVAVGRFFPMFTARIRRMTISSRTAGELVGVLDPGIDLLRQGRLDEAKAWFARVAEAPPSERTRAEARFYAALAEAAGEPRRQALLALARTPGQSLADHVLFVAVDQAVQEELWSELPGLIGELRSVAKPDLMRRVALNLIGQLQQWRWINAQRRAGLVAAFAATGEREFRAPGCRFDDLSALRGMALENVWVAEGELTDASPVIGHALRIAEFDGNRITSLPALAGLPISRLSLNRNPLASLAGVAGSKLEELNLADTLVGDLTPLAGMATLKRLDLGGTPVADLAPLRGLPLESLNLARTAACDLAPLAGMPLTNLDVSRTPVASLQALAGGSSRLDLDASASAITDLAPLRGRDVWRLMIHETGVRDLAPLAGSKLEALGLAKTKVSDLAPLAGCPLAKLDLADAPVTDLTVLGAAPLRELNLSGHIRGSLQPLIGKYLDLLVLPPGPYSAEQLGQFTRLKARELRLDPADATQWAAAEQIQGVARINGLQHGAALARRDACLALLAGRACELKTLVEPLPDLRLVLLPILATREEALRLAALAGGRLPCVAEPARYRQLTIALYRALARSDAPIQVGVASGNDRQPVWLDGSAWTDKPLRRDELDLLAAGGTVTFDVNRPYEVQPADTRTVLAIELP
jgi:hypothetical protein